MLFQVFFGMTLSFLVIPGVLEARPITFIESAEWNNLLIIGLFNVFDTAGRSIGGYTPLMIGMEETFLLHLFAFSRILIVIMAIMIEVGIFSGNLTAQNWLIIVNPMLLALTNGYVQTIFACYAATAVSKNNVSDGQARALGSLIALAMTLGIAAGGLLQIPFAKIE